MALYARLATTVRALAQSKLSLEEVNLWLDTALKNMTHALSMFDRDQRLILCNAHCNEKDTSARALARLPRFRHSGLQSFETQHALSATSPCSLAFDIRQRCHDNAAT